MLAETVALRNSHSFCTMKRCGRESWAIRGSAMHNIHYTRKESDGVRLKVQFKWVHSNSNRTVLNEFSLLS